MKRLLLICLGLVLLFTGCSKEETTYSPDSPEGIVSAYYQALLEENYEKAYELRKFDPPKTKDDFVSEKKSQGMSFKSFTVGKAEIKGSTATVPVVLKTGNSAVPEITSNVRMEKDTSWKIIDLGIGGMTMPGANPHSSMPSAGDNGSANFDYTVPPDFSGSPGGIPEHKKLQ